MDEGHCRYYALDLSSTTVDNLETNGRIFKNPRPHAFELSPTEGSILGQGLALMDWNIRHKYCSICGSTTGTDDAGYKRICGNDSCISRKSVQNVSHPRTDAVVITAIISEDGNKILLGRKPQWPTNRYSCIGIYN